jgi:acetyltransferase-like isoleucine patch superfamily enzyme
MTAGRRFREFVARGKGADPAVLKEWQGADLASLGWLLGLRLVRGEAVRRRLGHADGRVFCDRGVRLLHARHIRAGRDLNLEEGCQIMGLSRRGIVFGERCTVGRFAQIAPTNPVGGEPGEGLRMGRHSNIGPYSFIGCSGYIEIGDRVLMGPRVNLLAENHVFNDAATPIKDQGVVRQPIRIEDGCWLGAGCSVLAGVTIGHDSIVATGAVVTADVPPRSIVGGVPARVLQARDSVEPIVSTDDGSVSPAPAS